MKEGQIKNSREKSILQEEIVISPILDENIQSHLNESLIWTKAYREEEVNEDLKKLHLILYAYYIKFEGLKPIQCTKINTL